MLRASQTQCKTRCTHGQRGLADHGDSSICLSAVPGQLPASALQVVLRNNRFFTGLGGETRDKDRAPSGPFLIPNPNQTHSLALTKRRTENGCRTAAGQHP